ncbi:MAG: hypothetical protein R2710_01540 [Acidimicrobiales bacterium]
MSFNSSVVVERLTTGSVHEILADRLAFSVVDLEHGELGDGPLRLIVVDHQTAQFLSNGSVNRNRRTMTRSPSINKPRRRPRRSPFVANDGTSAECVYAPREAEAIQCNDWN